MSHACELTYLLPIRRAALEPDDDLFAYVRSLVPLVAAVVVVDGSAPETFAAHAAHFGPGITHVPVDASERGRNGKVCGVRTGMKLARTPHVVIGDEDVRHSPQTLERVGAALELADVVRPQNYFEPRPWHARLDEGRSLIARALGGGDWPGTLGVRTATFRRAGGYASDVLFENLELVRTIIAHAGVERRLDDLFVSRRPPAARHYLGQRVRQAYDEFARPPMLVAQLALVPAFSIAAYVARPALATAAFALAAIALAECGRCRARGRTVFPLTSSLLAPVWMFERAVTSWCALAAFARGGARYGGGRIRTAAHSLRALRRAACTGRATRSFARAPHCAGQLQAHSTER